MLAQRRQKAGARAGLMPQTARAYRVRLDFAAWIERMRTPTLMVAAIHDKQIAPERVHDYFADLGAEKFFDIKCRASGLRPDAAVVGHPSKVCAGVEEIPGPSRRHS